MNTKKFKFYVLLPYSDSKNNMFYVAKWYEIGISVFQMMTGCEPYL